MPELVIIPIGLFAIWYFAYGQALLSQNTAQAHSSWLGWLVNQVKATVAADIQQVVQLSKFIAHYMFPALEFAEKKVAAWFAANSTIIEWQGNHAHRTAKAVFNVADWANKDLRREIVERAKAEAANEVGKNALTKVPPVPQRRLTQRQVDIEFQRLIEGNFTRELAKHDPKFDWDPKQWRKYLGILPALGGAVVHPHPTTPQIVPQPQPQPGTGTVPIGPPQPATLPHTDDQPNPDPGTQVVPGVVSGKDKWARGQVVKLNKKQTSILNHLGPLAFLTIPLAGITTLIGLLECKNFSRFLPKFCSMPTNLLSDLLALITDFLILTNICTVLPWIEDAANEVLPFLTEFTTGAAALACSGGRQISPTLTVPTLQLPPSTGTLPALQLP